MKTVKRQAIVPYKPQQMFDLVNNVSSYPEFLSGCERTEIHHQTENTMEASLFIKKAAIALELRTVNELVSGKSITMQLKSGPFKSLKGEWHFIPLGDNACKITLDLAFELSSRALGVLLGKVFAEVVTGMLDAFIDRASQVYGKEK